MAKQHELYEAYKELTPKEKILFKRLQAAEDKKDKLAVQLKQLEICNDLVNAGMNKDWVVKNILRF